MVHKKHIPTALVILDGFGFRTNSEGNAIALAKTPNLDRWLKIYPNTVLKASGTAVGLPEGTIGNSEVGHITIGTGRIIQQPLTVINHAIEDGSFFTNPILCNELGKLRTTGKTVHIMGLLSNAGVHSSTKHLYAFIKAAQQQGIARIVVHPFLDGRDVAPKSAEPLLETLQKNLEQTGIGIIGSLHGRFYAMDRDRHWERTEKSYRVLTQKQNGSLPHWREALQASYAQGITDEFFVPTQVAPNAQICNGDGIIFINIRPDRARQLTQCFTQPHFKQFKTQALDLAFFITPVTYGTQTPSLVLYPQPIPDNTLKDILAQHEKTIFSIAETEKYAHVTYFFSGGNEKIVHHEIRILIPSIKAVSYAPYPAMSAPLITQAVIKSLRRFPRDFYLINYANADMVGHSGNLNATIKAIEVLDEELGKLYDVVVQEMGGTLYITADHGKAEQMIDSKTGQPRTAHTTNPVPFIMLRKGLENSGEKLPLKGLSDIAGFILKEMLQGR